MDKALVARVLFPDTVARLRAHFEVDDNVLDQARLVARLLTNGLDVYEGEPRVHPALLGVDNVVLAPHIGSASIATRRAMAELAADNLIAALGCSPPAGRPPTPANPAVLALR